jgi:hypothetical protein
VVAVKTEIIKTGLKRTVTAGEINERF